MEATFDKRKLGDNASSPLLTYLMLVLGVMGFAVAALILLGWLPLGARANILRSDKNWVEWIVVIVSVIYGIAGLRTFYGLSTGEKAGTAWTQWVSFLTIFIGLAITFSVVLPAFLKVFFIDAPQPLPLELQVFYAGLLLSFVGVLGIVYQLSVRTGLIANLFPNTGFIRRTIDENTMIKLNIPVGGSLLVILLGLLCAAGASLIWVSQFPFAVPNIRTPEPMRLIPGLFLLISGLWAYRQVSRGEEQSDELRRAISLIPDKWIRFELAKSPSAGAIIGFLAIFLAFTMATDLFLTPTSVGSILTNVSSKGVIAIGVTILMISGEFDLSVGSILGVVAMFFMQFMTEGAPVLGVLDPLPAAFLAIFIGAIMGFINGFILVTTGIPSFIVTLGTMLAYRSIALVAIAGGRILRYRDYYSDFPQTFLPSWFVVTLAVIGVLLLLYTAWRVLPRLWQRVFVNWNQRAVNGYFGTTKAITSTVIAFLITAVLIIAGFWLALIVLDNFGGETIQVGFFDLVNGRWEGQMLLGRDGFSIGGIRMFAFSLPSDANFRMAIVWWFILVLFFHVILTSTPYGSSVFAVGGNVGAARAQGINVAFVKVFNFILVAVLTSVAAIYETARNPGVDPLKGNQWELEVIAMTVIGGALLSGGYGSILGSLLGALIFGMLQTGLVLVGIESRLFTGTVGIVIIVAVVLNTTVRGKRR